MLNPHLTAAESLPFRRVRPARGMTLLELTVVILVLLSMVAILFVGARAWRRGTDRALCIIHIQTVQKGVRSYSNFHDLAPGAAAPDLRVHVIGRGAFVEAAPQCPGRGTYGFGGDAGENSIPAVGELYMHCSLADSADHSPPGSDGW